MPSLDPVMAITRSGRWRSWRWAGYFVLFYLSMFWVDSGVLAFYGIQTPPRSDDAEGTITSFDLTMAGLLLLSQATLGFLLSESMRRREIDLARAAEQRFLLLGRIAASMAHEMRNPIHNLRLLVESLRDRPGGEGDPALGRIEDNLERLDQAVRLAHELARPAVVVDDADQPVVDLVAVVGRALAETRQRRPGCRMTWCPPAAAPLPVRGREMALRMVAENLLRNAVDAAPGGGVTVSLDAARGQAVLRIVNPGRLPEPCDEDGIPVAAPAGAGFGIGLGIARHLAASAGGRLRLVQDGDAVVATVAFPVLEESR